MTAPSRVEKLTLELLAGVEAYDSKDVLRALKRILPRHTRRVMVVLAVLAVAGLKQQHGEDWPNHVTPSLETFEQEAP